MSEKEEVPEKKKETKPTDYEIKKLNLYERIAGVMREIEYLQKDSRVEYRKDGRVVSQYSAVSEEKVTSTVRKVMLKYRLVFIPKSVEMVLLDPERKLTQAITSYWLVNIDNPEEREEMMSAGHGQDSADKGSGKALTYAYKYLQLRAFALPSGEDPDMVHSDTLADLDEWEQEKTALIAEVMGYYKELKASPAKQTRTNLEHAGNASLAKSSIDGLTVLVEHLRKVTPEYKKSMEKKGVAKDEEGSHQLQSDTDGEMSLPL